MDEVSVYGTGKRRYEMKMFLENVEHGFDLRSIRKKFVLKRGRDLFLLREMGRGDEDGPIPFPQYPSHHLGPVVGIADPDPRVFIHE